MNELARWDPFQESPLSLIPALFQPIGVRAAMDAAMRGPRMDVFDTGEAYQLCVELPGVKKEAIQVNVYRNNVTISAELADETRDAEQAGEESRWLLRERSFGKFSRSIALPEELDDGASQAKYADGVLTLTLKKQRASQTRRLTVH